MDDNYADWQGKHIESLLTANSESEFFAALSSAARELGFDYCAYGMRLPWPITSPKLIMVNNYSEAWQKRYAEKGYLAVDPTVQHGMKSVLPLLSRPQYAQRLKAGPARGGEAVMMTENVRSFHDILMRLEAPYEPALALPRLKLGHAD